MNILVLESSTSSAKAMLYDTCRRTCAVQTQHYPPHLWKGGMQDADEVFLRTAEVGKALCEGKPVDAIALGGTWHSVMLCSEAMVPETMVYPWTYTGAAALCGELRQDAGYTRRYYQKTGCMVSATYPFFKLKLLREQGYRLENYRILGQGTYNTYRFTGRWAVTDCMASASGLFNIRSGAYDADLLAELGIVPAQLGELVTYQDALPLSEEGAALLGISSGIPVIPCMPDGSLNQVGSNALKGGIMTFSVGTSGAVRLSANRPVLPETPSTWCYRSPTTWLCGAATSGACNCIDWFRHSVACDMRFEDLEKGFSGNEDDLPLFLPFLYGERCPGWNDEREASFFGLKPHHTIYDMYRAVQEGILYNLYQCYDVLVSLNGVPEKIKLSGGILHSPAWTQMCADIFGIALEPDPVKQSSLMGGAALAMSYLGLVEDITDLEDILPSDSKKVLPRPDSARYYRKQYARYLDCYNKG